MIFLGSQFWLLFQLSYEFPHMIRARVRARIRDKVSFLSLLSFHEKIQVHLPLKKASSVL